MNANSIFGDTRSKGLDKVKCMWENTVVANKTITRFFSDWVLMSSICDTSATDARDRFTQSGQVPRTHHQGVDWSVTSDRPPGPFSPQQAYLNN
jgi:hypothetical protein